MPYLNRALAKIRLWVNFYKISENFFAICRMRLVNILSLDNIFKYNAEIKLKKGIRIGYGPRLDLSAVPAVVEIWYEQPYNPPGFEIGPQDIVFDVGANVGNFSVYAAQKTKNSIYSFEPIVENFILFQENINRNRALNIIPINAAVTGSTGSAQMNLSYAGTAHSIVQSEYSIGQTVTVSTVDMMSFCRDHNIQRIDFLKIDCEGAENEIILGLAAEFLAQIVKIAIEHHERFTHIDHTAINRHLEKHGFSVHEAQGQYIYAKKYP
jgi:FkbM family methyltransferase